MPIILLLLAAGAAFYVLRKRPALPSPTPPSSGPPIFTEGPDALALLNFMPFTLQSGRPTTLFFLAPSGLNVSQARAAGTLAHWYDEATNQLNMTIFRAGIPIPSATGSSTAVADLWQVQSGGFAPGGGAPSVTISPSLALSRIMNIRGLLASNTNIQPAAQLTNLLYTNALATAAGRQQPLFIPVQGRQ